MIVRLAGAEDRPLHVHFADPAAHHFGDQIPALLIGQPADEADERRPRRLGRPSSRCRAALQAALPVCQLLTSNFSGKVRIGRRIPDAVIDAVDDAGQHVAPLLQHAFEPAAERIALNFLGIRAG